MDLFDNKENKNTKIGYNNHLRALDFKRVIDCSINKMIVFSLALEMRITNVFNNFFNEVQRTARSITFFQWYINPIHNHALKYRKIVFYSFIISPIWKINSHKLLWNWKNLFFPKKEGSFEVWHHYYNPRFTVSFSCVFLFYFSDFPFLLLRFIFWSFSLFFRTISFQIHTVFSIHH